MNEIEDLRNAPGAPPHGRPVLLLSHRPEADSLSALPFGLVEDGQPPERWVAVGEGEDQPVGLYRLTEGGPIIGFAVHDLGELDLDRPDLSAIWDEPLFDVPVLALRAAPAGAIIAAARTHFGDRPSLNRIYFDLAVNLSGTEALEHWRACLEAGDSMAHFAIGYTLFELERYELAYRHLRYYAEIAPAHPWNWCWLGKAAEAVGEPGEARAAYERAIDLEEQGGDATDAPGLLAALDGGRA